VHIPQSCGHFSESHGNLSRISGLKELSIAVRGLKKLTLNLPIPSGYSTISYTVGIKELFARIENLLMEQMEKPRGAKFSLQDEIRNAKLSAKLDIHGDGRLGEDKKPNVRL
jgi:hypothetical protein